MRALRRNSGTYLGRSVSDVSDAIGELIVSCWNTARPCSDKFYTRKWIWNYADLRTIRPSGPSSADILILDNDGTCSFVVVITENVDERSLAVGVRESGC